MILFTLPLDHVFCIAKLTTGGKCEIMWGSVNANLHKTRQTDAHAHSRTSSVNQLHPFLQGSSLSGLQHNCRRRPERRRAGLLYSKTAFCKGASKLRNQLRSTKARVFDN